MSQFDGVPLLEAVATIDEERAQLTLFAVNRGPGRSTLLEGDLRALPGYEVVEHLVLEHDEPKTINTWRTDTRCGRTRVAMPPARWRSDRPFAEALVERHSPAPSRRAP